LQQALETVPTIADPQERFDVLMRIARVQGETGEPAGARKTRQAALEVARGLADGRPKVRALTGLALAQAEAGDRGAMSQTMRQVEQAAAAIPDAHEKGNALVQLVRAQAHLGDYAGGLRTAADSGDFRASALGLFAAALRTADRPAARKALAQAFDLAKDTASLPDRSRALTAIAGAQVKVGDLAGALRTADALDDRWKATVLGAIASAQAGAGDVAGALRTAGAIGPPEARANALLAVAVAQGKAGDGAAARATLQDVRRLADALPKDSAVRGRGPAGRSPGAPRQSQLRERLAIAQVRLGDVSGARQTAAAIDSELEKARALLEIGTAQTAAGKRAEALQTLRDAARAAQHAGGADGPGGAATLRQIAEQQAKAGDIPEALRTTASIPTDQERDTARAEIMPAQAAAGDVKGALASLALVKDGSWKGYALEELARAQVRAGDERGALALAAGQASPYLKARVLVGMARGRAAPRQTAP
jgi:hypothetical protein